MGKSAPEAPDYTAAAQATAQSSRNATNASTVANRPDQVTPFGSQTWDSQQSFDDAGYNRALQDWQAQGATLGKDAKNPDYLALRPQQNDFYSQKWTQNTTLAPDAQRALDAQMGLQAGRSELGASLLPRAQNEFGTEMDYSGLTDSRNGPQAEQLQRSIGNTSDYANQAGDAIAKKFSTRMEPQFQQDTERLDQTLRNRGLKPGDAAYDDALAKSRQSQNDAREQANYQSIIGTGQEASRLQGMDLNAGNFANTAAGQSFQQGQSSAGFNNTLRQQQLAEAMQKRGFSLNEINALISGQQVGMPSMPGYTNAGTSQATNYSGAAQNQYGAALDATNAKNAGIGNLLGAVSAPFSFGFGG